MATYKLTLEYDGSAYAGWQYQPDQPTLQATLESVLKKITQTSVPVIAAGRTDAGVHALGQVVSFCSDKPLVLQKWLRAFNGLLPKDMGIKEIEMVPDTFHARYSAVAKEYEYRIWNDPVRPVLDRDRMWHVPHPLHLSLMREATRHLNGHHDFSSFQGSNTETTDSQCHLHRLDIIQDGHHIRIIAEADRFLKHMVRALVGTLVEIGHVKRTPSDLKHILDAKDRRAAGKTAPPHGLYLVAVRYKESK